MNTEREVDFIIVGQGLAGSTLAIELTERHQKVFVYDEPDKNHSSIVAAGLFNPITGRIMSKTWKADLLFPQLLKFYEAAERKLKTHFFHRMPLFRPFISVQEQNEWMGKSADADVKSYLEQVRIHSAYGHHIYDDFGGLLLSQSGYVDTHLFILAVREHLLRQESYTQEHFVESDLIMAENFIAYKGLRARKIIYCNGDESVKSRFFEWLPFKPLKGETIQIKVDQKFDCIYNRGVYVVPTHQAGFYKVGATYNTKDLTSSITSDGRTELTNKLNELLKLPYEVATQNWGIRPSTADRRPFLGNHPVEQNVVIFNGLGTKGVSLAPYFANQLAGWLMGEGEIDWEVDINRCKFKK